MKSNKKVLIKKLVTILILFTMFSYIFNINNQSQALTIRPREEITEKLNKYPGVTELINKLKEAHPEWNFRILYTGLDWNQVIKNEATHGRNLVSKTRTSAWICPICGDKAYDNGSWRCASEAAISYFMDPRNSLNETYVFQFEALSYNKDIQTIDGVNQIIKDVKYMQADKITYTKTDGTEGTIEKTYAQVIMEAAEEANVSPYHLAARIRQEQGTGNSPTVIANGKHPNFTGYYNFFNIKASGNTEAEIITNALNYAKSKGLTDPEKSIKEGAKFLARNYISAGQDTLYLQKFDVDDSDGALYYFQYMQNISASRSEGLEVRDSYKELGILDSKIDFIIPVYENMPELPCPEPIPDGVVTQNVKVKGDRVNVRDNKSTTANSIATVNTGDELLRIETATSTNNGHYWDKVVLPDGRQGYIARQYLVEIPNITNCNDTMVVTSTVNLRNGPGVNGTTIITTVVKGQMITRIETGKYNLDGHIWDRVVLADGRQGYLAQTYIGLPGSNDEQVTQEIIRVICQSGLKVRKEPGTDKIVSAYLLKGDTLTRLEKNVSNANGYVWDKVVTNNGIEGYIARGDSKEQYIEVVKQEIVPPTTPDTPVTPPETNEPDTPEVPENPEVPEKPEIPEDTQKPETEKPTVPPTDEPFVPTENNNDFKLEDTKLISEPETTVENVKEKYSTLEVKVTKPDGTVVESGSIGTGYTVKIGENTYTVVKLGDANGDGKITAGDYVVIKNQIMGIGTIDEKIKDGADANQDGKITAGDYVIIKNHIMGTNIIEL